MDGKPRWMDPRIPSMPSLLPHHALLVGNKTLDRFYWTASLCCAPSSKSPCSAKHTDVETSGSVQSFRRHSHPSCPPAEPNGHGHTDKPISRKLSLRLRALSVRLRCGSVRCTLADGQRYRTAHGSWLTAPVAGPRLAILYAGPPPLIKTLHGGPGCCSSVARRSPQAQCSR